MKNQIIQLILLTGFALFVYFSLNDNFQQSPTPTEYIQEKEDRKIFKKQRQEWIEQMHRTAPDVDWRKIDAETRKQKSKNVNHFRQNLKINENWTSADIYHRQIGNRDITGVWSERGSNNNAGRIHTADVDLENGLIYCGSSGGNIWRGSITGEGWVSLNDHMQIYDIKMLRLIDTDTGSRILICGGDSFYFTDDEGFTIIESTGLENLEDWGSILRSVVMNDELRTIYVLVKEWNYFTRNAIAVLYKSTNHGENFEQIITFDNNNGYDIWTPKYSEEDLFLIHNGTLYVVSESDELQFAGSFTTFASGDNLLTGGMDEDGIYLYARIDEQIYYSGNGGADWEHKGIQPQWTFTRNSFNSSNINRNVICLGSMELFRSFDNGDSWNLVNNWYDYYSNPANKLHADIPEIRFFLDDYGDEFALISTDGGLYISTDNLNTVENLSLYGLGVSQYYSTYTLRSNPYHVYAGSQDQGFQRSEGDEGGILEFEQSISGDYGHLVSGDGGESIWCVYPGFVMYYDSPQYDTGGMTWNFLGSNYLWMAPLMAHPTNPEKCFIGGGGISGGFHMIELSAAGWSITHNELSFNFDSEVSAMAYSPIDPSIYYVMTYNGTFYTSFDSGNSWDQTSGFSGPSPHYFYGSTIYPSTTDVNIVVIGGSGYSNPSVYVSENFGESFSPMHNGIPNTLVYEITGNELGDLLFAATEVGPYVFDSVENQWFDLAGISAPDQIYWTVDYIPELRTARFGTYGRGIWDFIIDEYYDLISGDVNNDQIVNILDIIMTVNFILNNIEPNESQFWAADLNGDESIDILDIVELVSIILDN